ncbi:ribonuclease M5 [Marinilactibacillus psychrotolerans]|uniref:Ribonuclease M5 n=2 Tax=Marinilactibacillus psychrotolerans TaxID=191770 RepID=A0AAV3WNM7_9LACT|nr:ribonuclease M5 [Marinilactibacillus psychrotolerans]SDC12704.1 ribonuclease M5 [Marinilactibacillus psychrotolerans]SJN36346.1 Ribonuclease M5 [Marinilactibacillus psychrotolerans 42ea]GEL65959.1 ribonuclease M5 1 [Marinilactibacillus psychrotolerans]GEQ32466.1 ribonuclease M5 [Marinilactibacillus psychrotolerans]GEQ34765.1 ribonuclease M5 [Marinilactibacillus psychrotolerans]
MKKINEVIVVEGRDDTKRIRMAVDADTIETNGSAIDEETLTKIEHAQKKRGVIVFTDPDVPGEMIRKTISRRIPGVKHAFLNREEAKPNKKGSLGIEHASIEIIQKALEGLYNERPEAEPTIDRLFLLNEGLMGKPHSKELRIKLGNELRIGYTNGKQLEKRLNMFGITQEKVEKALKKIRKEEANE